MSLSLKIFGVVKYLFTLGGLKDLYSWLHSGVCVQSGIFMSPIASSISPAVCYNRQHQSCYDKNEYYHNCYLLYCVLQLCTAIITLI